ncbi:MAG: hypothetical protein C0515_04865 [Novosphingobium sp.]|nr:hypothetical protein [Novosphingobium sp.]MBX9644496.1 hypothetical protein [Novosphingobium sp.]
MKKIALIALLATAAVATPAAAQSVTGTINLTGSVASKCFVSPGSGSTFTDTVAFGELAVADGTLRTDLASAFGTKSFTVKCNSAAPTISVDSTALATTATASSGYDNSIDFQASVALTTIAANNGPFLNDSSNAALAATAVGSSLANSTGNVSITTSNYRTNNATDLLVASPTYTGSIVVVIAPN